jgi:hypothetical protein
MEQVGEVINFVLDVPSVESMACTTHPVSDGDNPLARKEIVTPLVAPDGVRINPGAPWVTFKIPCAKSPTLGAQPLLP